MMNTIDEDGEGEVTFDELYQWCASTRPQTRHTVLVNTFVYQPTFHSLSLTFHSLSLTITAFRWPSLAFR